MLTNEHVTERSRRQVEPAPRGYRHLEPTGERTPRLLATVGGTGQLAARSGALARYESVAHAVGRQAASAGRPAKLGTPARSVPSTEPGRAAVADRRGTHNGVRSWPPKAKRCWPKSCGRRLKANRKCTSSTMPRPNGCKRRTPRRWPAAPTRPKIVRRFGNSTFPRIGKP